MVKGTVLRYFYDNELLHVHVGVQFEYNTYFMTFHYIIFTSSIVYILSDVLSKFLYRACLPHMWLPQSMGEEILLKSPKYTCTLYMYICRNTVHYVHTCTYNSTPQVQTYRVYLRTCMYIHIHVHVYNELCINPFTCV